MTPVVKEITTDKRQFMNLLLIGDEQESMVERYIDRCRLFIGYISGIPSACCAVTSDDDDIVEIKNLAVIPEHRCKGIGRSMLEHVESLFPGKSFQLGTGETPSTLRFYRNCGYRESHRILDFFTENYDHPIIEEGVRLKDMVYLKKELVTAHAYTSLQSSPPLRNLHHRGNASRIFHKRRCGRL